MNISFSSFETEVDPAVLARGRDYYQAGRVSVLEEAEDGWTATVLGSVPYQISVAEEGEGNLLLSCTCPYDRGPVCKHMVAVLFTIKARDGAEPADGREEVVEAYPRRRALKEELERLAL